MDVRECKRMCRLKAAQAIDTIPKSELLKASREACERAWAFPEVKNARVIMLYSSVEREADPSMIAERAREAGAVASYPKCTDGRRMLALVPFDESAWETGRFGIREPDVDRSSEIDPRDIDCVIVPGAAFDRNGRRLGRGGGYYDRFLAQTGAFRLGFCLEAQLIDDIPVEPHDLCMDAVVTQSGFYRMECKTGYK